MKYRLYIRGILALAWIYVFLAAIIEVFWVIGLKYSETAFQWTITIIIIIISFYLIIKACEYLPSGTVYAVFTGSGAAMIVIVDIVKFGADFSLVQLLFVALIVIGVVGIKLTSTEADQAIEKGES